LLVLRRPRQPTLLPYTTLFRSTAPPGGGTCGGGLRRRRLDPLRQCSLVGTARRARCGWAAGQAACTAAGRARQQSRQGQGQGQRSEEHTSELQSRENLVCRLLL